MAIIDTSTAKTLLGITTTDHDTRIDALIPEVESHYLRIRGKAFEVDDQDQTVYPDGSELTAAQMIGYHLFGPAQGAASEKVDDYSITAEERVEGYPRSIIGAIARYGAYR